MDLFNEWFVLLVTYHLYCFTEFVPDFDTQAYMGTSLVYTIGVNLAANLLLSAVQALILAVRNANLRYRRRKYRKAMKLKADKQRRRRY